MGLPVFNGTLSFQLPQFVFHQICWESSFRHRKLIPATVELRHWQWVCSCTDAWVCVFAGPLRTRRLQLAQLRYPSISQLASQPADSTRPANKYPLASIYTHTHTHTHTQLESFLHIVLERHMLVRYWLWPRVCLLRVGVLSKRLDGSSFGTEAFFDAQSIIHCFIMIFRYLQK